MYGFYQIIHARYLHIRRTHWAIETEVLNTVATPAARDLRWALPLNHPIHVVRIAQISTPAHRCA
jgi:hypothetical protein